MCEIGIFTTFPLFFHVLNVFIELGVEYNPQDAEILEKLGEILQNKQHR